MVWLGLGVRERGFGAGKGFLRWAGELLDVRGLISRVSKMR